MRSFVSIIAATLLICSSTQAQTGPVLMLKPWENDQKLELNFDAFIFADSNTDSAVNDSFDLKIYESSGRTNLSKDEAHAFNVGYQLLHIDIGSTDPLLPERLTEIRVSVGYDFGPYFEGEWNVSATFGVGYAGDAAFNDSDAWFLLADVILTKQIDAQSTLQLVFNYDGNRSFLPDVPLPSFLYTRRVNEQFTYGVGFPYNLIIWKPADKWTVEANYWFPLTMNLVVSYEVCDFATIFARLQNRYRGFHIEGDGNDEDRLYFQQRRIEAGVDLKPCANASIIVAVGYAFDQSFEFGWDVRDTNTVQDVDAAPYLRVGGEIRF